MRMCSTLFGHIDTFQLFMQFNPIEKAHSQRTPPGLLHAGTSKK